MESRAPNGPPLANTVHRKTLYWTGCLPPYRHTLSSWGWLTGILVIVMVTWSCGTTSDNALRVLAIIILKMQMTVSELCSWEKKLFANELSLIRLQRPWNVLVFLYVQLWSVHVIRTFECSGINRRLGISGAVLHLEWGWPSCSRLGKVRSGSTVGTFSWKNFLFPSLLLPF